MKKSVGVRAIIFSIKQLECTMKKKENGDKSFVELRMTLVKKKTVKKKS